VNFKQRPPCVYFDESENEELRKVHIDKSKAHQQDTVDESENKDHTDKFHLGLGLANDFVVTNFNGNTAPPKDDEVNSIVQKVWERHRRWSQLASKKKRVIQRARVAALTCSVLGAALQTLSVPLETWLPMTLNARVPQLIGSGMLALAPWLTTKYCAREMIREWYRSRAVSEDIKAQVFLFRARIEPYNREMPPDESLPLLIQEVGTITESAKDMNKHYVMTQEAGSNNNDKKKQKHKYRAPPPSLDREGYMKYRVEAQKNGFYLRLAKLYSKRSVFLRRLETTFAALAALSGFFTVVASTSIKKLSSAATPIGGLGPSLALAATSVATHLSASNYDNQVEDYSASAMELENLQLRLPSSSLTSEEEWTRFVLDCEQVVAATTKRWATPNHLYWKQHAGVENAADMTTTTNARLQMNLNSKTTQR